MTTTTQKLLEDAAGQFARAIHTISQSTGRIAEAEAVYESLSAAAGDHANDVHLHCSVTGSHLDLSIQLTRPLQEVFEIILKAGLVIAGSASTESAHGTYNYIHTTIRLHDIDVTVRHCEAVLLAANDHTAEAMSCAA